MPHSSAFKAFVRRNYNRSVRHGKSWRQTVVDSAGVCCHPDLDGAVCGAIELLELHAEFGEGDGRFTEGRILYCQSCHAEVHPRRFNVDNNHDQSRLMEDVSAEIIFCGGYKQWIKKHQLDDARFGSLLPAEDMFS